MEQITQEQQVVNAMREMGGYATFRKLNDFLDFTTWKTKTPEASVRRIVQDSKQIFRIQPGLWALEEFRDTVMRKFDLQPGNKKSEDVFTHGYFQGLLVEIGKYRNRLTYVPAQDKNRKFIGQSLGDMTDTTVIPQFTYECLLKRARTVDVIWFNERKMPSDFYEVEHTTDIKNSLSKFYELQDFHAKFYIVADKCRKKEFDDKIHVSMFAPIEARVKFIDYDSVAKMYEGLKTITESMW